MSTKRVVVVFSIVLCGVGMVSAQTEWIGHPGNPVVETEDPGSWAPGGPWIGSIVFDGSTYHMWFTGSKDNYYANDIGHATSEDGIEWTMDPSNPVLTKGDSGEWDDDPLIAGAVIYDGSQFHMWYTGTDEVAENIGYATSPDGSVWTKYSGNPVMEVGACGAWDDKWLMSGAVIDDGDTYMMWYSGSNGSIGKIGYAESPDGIDWTKRPDPVLEPGDYPGEWEGSLQSPTVVYDDDCYDDDCSTYHMWYVGNHSGEFNKIGYAYSGDGIEWTKHRGNPVIAIADDNIEQSCALYDGDTFRLWYSSFSGAATADYRVSYATSDCCGGLAALDTWRYIPAAAVASGAQGAFFQTDVDISNADDRAAKYEFSWLPRAEDNSEPETSEIFSLAAGKSTRYANVLSEVFDLEPDSVGALLIKSSNSDLLAMSRTYNSPGEETGGTYGQAMPAIDPDEFIQHGEVRRILCGTENADMRTNIGCQNGTDASTVVYLDLFDSDGTALGREMLILKPLGNEQVNRIFDGHNPVTGYVDVSLVQPGRYVYCYGSVLDNVTNDPTTTPPQ